MLEISLAVELAFYSATFVIFLYAAYWAFSIRSALAIGVYRNQALGVGLIALTSSIFILEVVLLTRILEIFNTTIFLETFVPTLFTIALLTFYWIDASVRAARRSDPLVRDTLHWRRLRQVLWAVIIAGLAVFTIVTALSLASLFPVLSSSWVTAPAVTGLSGAIALPLSAWRSKDMTFQRHLKWFGGYVGFQLSETVASALFNLFPLALVNVKYLTIAAVLLIGSAYCLYRGARSLAPLNRLTAQ